MSTLSLAIIRKNDIFINLYSELVRGTKLEPSDYKTLLSLAVLFINSKNKDVKKLGYRIFVLYSNVTKDYTPLYEISINLGLYPVSQFIQSNIFSHDEPSFFSEFNASFLR